LPRIVLARLKTQARLTIPDACVKSVAIANIVSRVTGRPLVSRGNSLNAVIPISIRIIIRIPRLEKLFQPGAVSGTAIFHAGPKTFRKSLAVLFLRSEAWLIIPVRLPQFLVDDILIAVTDL